MKKILAIGGAVIKTAREELKKAIEDNKVEMLIHNGGSIFHDFQLSIDNDLDSHSYTLDALLEDFECNRGTSEILWSWIKYDLLAPIGSVTRLCEDKSIPVLSFTSLGCDFWQLFDDNWEAYARKTKRDFYTLCRRMGAERFHYVCMGSAVIHPEVFTKVLAAVKPEDFTADVVDFLDMYRPRTRVAKYGTYYKTTHKKFFNEVM